MHVKSALRFVALSSAFKYKCEPQRTCVYFCVPIVAIIIANYITCNFMALLYGRNPEEIYISSKTRITHSVEHFLNIDSPNFNLWKNQLNGENTLRSSVLETMSSFVEAREIFFGYSRSMVGPGRCRDGL